MKARLNGIAKLYFSGEVTIHLHCGQSYPHLQVHRLRRLKPLGNPQPCAENASLVRGRTVLYNRWQQRRESWTHQGGTSRHFIEIQTSLTEESKPPQIGKNICLCTLPLHIRKLRLEEPYYSSGATEICVKMLILKLVIPLHCICNRSVAWSRHYDVW